MPRDGNDVYSKPSGTTATAGTTIESAKYNTLMDDIVSDLNAARPIAVGGTGASTASAARTALGVEIGADVQDYDAGLASIAGLTTAADKMVYTTASDTYAVTGLTSFARTLLDDTDAATARATLGADYANNITSGTLPAGRLPAATTTAVGAVEKSTSGENTTGTATDKFPDVAGVKEMLDTFAMGWNVLETQTASTSDELDFVLPSASLYAGVRFVLIDVLPNTDGDYLRLQTSTDGGSTFAATTGDYDYANVVLAAGGTVIASDNDNSFFAGIAHFIGTAAGEDGVNGAVEIFGANNAGKTKMTYQVSFLTTSGKLRGEHGAAARMADGAVDAIRFTAGDNSTTNKIASGTIIMLGLRVA
jgi:hypothetical protein